MGCWLAFRKVEALRVWRVDEKEGVLGLFGFRDWGGQEEKRVERTNVEEEEAIESGGGGI